MSFTKLVKTVFVILGLSITSIHAETYRIASWNLGWHVSKAELPIWIEACSRSFVKEEPFKDEKWKIVSNGLLASAKGWDITGDRPKLEGVDLSVMPPCSSYKDAGYKGIAVTPESYQSRLSRLAMVLANDVAPDVIAFQEVSGVQAVREALGAIAQNFNICSFDGRFKVQRLAFAWKKTLGDSLEPCQTIDAVSIPSLSSAEQVRPAFQVALQLGKKKVRFLTVHLKSSCVSSLDKGNLDSLTDRKGACAILQKQVASLEVAFEALHDGVDHFVFLGDFNRNLWHEKAEVSGSEAKRSDNSSLTSPLLGNITTKNLFKEINDGVPATSNAELISIKCSTDPVLQKICDDSKERHLTSQELKPLREKTSLGCSYPVGLDHILTSLDMTPFVGDALKISIGTNGVSYQASTNFPQPRLSVSDHCPSVVSIKF